MTIRVTNAAEGLPRYAFTVADVERMVAVGILPESERVELIDGELVVMSAKGDRHNLVSTYLNIDLVRALPKGLLVSQETTFKLSLHTYLEPDFVLYRVADGVTGLNGATALLAIEVSDSSLSYDLGRKLQVYARHGVREVWVVDAVRLVTHVHAAPEGERYTRVSKASETDALSPADIPEIRFTLRDVMTRER
jgi:Uma2 family endonuclease